MYGSVVWNNINLGQSKKIESIRRKFLRYASGRIGYPMDFRDHDFQFTSRRFKVCTLISARKCNDLIFLYKLFNSNFLCDELIEFYSLYEPGRDLRLRDRIFNNSTFVFFNNINSFVNRSSILANENSAWFSLTNKNLSFVTNTSKTKLLKYE